MSAGACLAGFFPPKGNQIWNEHLNWQPIPVHLMDQDYYAHSCDRKDALYASADQKIFNELVTKYGTLIRYVEENSGEQLTTLMDIQNIFNTLHEEKSKNFRYMEHEQCENVMNNAYISKLSLACHCGQTICWSRVVILNSFP